MFKTTLILGILFCVPLFAEDFKSGELIVKYKDAAPRDRLTMEHLYDQIGVKSVRRFSKIQGLEHFILKDSVQVQDAVAELRRNPDVEYAQPNYRVHILPYHEAAVVQPEGLPFPWGNSRPDLKPAPADVNPPIADPDLGKAYGLAAIGAQDAWKIFRGSKKFIVADLDSGIDYNHKDLSFNVWRNPHPSDANDIVGYDFVHHDGLPFDDNNHGTHTAGTIGAVGGNGIGISGVAQRVSIMAVKFIASDGSGDTASAIQALNYAIQNGARVINASWGGVADPTNKAMQDAISVAEKNGILFVAAAGNDGIDNDTSDQASFPATFNLPNIISVAAVNAGDELAYYSNYGKTTVHLAAPGSDVYSTVPGNEYMKDSGTSMACPHVAGAAALLWSRHPDWTYLKVKQVLLDTVDSLPGLQDKTVSGGRLNIGKAMSQSEGT